MRPAAAHRSEDDVLSDFAAEPDHSRHTLEAYLRAHPQFSDALLDLSHELNLQAALGPQTATAEEEAWLAEAWGRFSAASQPAVQDPFGALTAAQTVVARRSLGVPNAVFRGLRNRLVVAEGIPRGFLRRLATAIGASVDGLFTFLQGPPMLAAGASYKADQQPAAATEKMSFEALLIDAQVSAETRQALLNETD